MKTLDSATRQRIEARVREATPEFTATAAEREEFDSRTGKQLRRLEPAIVTIGSHTLTHPILPRNAGRGAGSEVRDSRRQLERGLERPVDTFAYPNGDLDPPPKPAYASTIASAVTTPKVAWYDAAPTSFGCPGSRARRAS